MKLAAATPKSPTAIAMSTPEKPPGCATRGSVTTAGVASKLVEVVAVRRVPVVAGGRGGLSNTVNTLVGVVALDFCGGWFDTTVDEVVFGDASGGRGTRVTRGTCAARGTRLVGGTATGAEERRARWGR